MITSTVPMMLVMFTWWQITMIVVKMMIVTIITMATHPPSDLPHFRNFSSVGKLET